MIYDLPNGSTRASQSR